MSDKRHCDGPDCDKTAELDSEDFAPIALAEVAAYRYITLERGRGMRTLHFHNEQCLTAWTNESTTSAGGGRVTKR